MDCTDCGCLHAFQETYVSTEWTMLIQLFNIGRFISLLPSIALATQALNLFKLQIENVEMAMEETDVFSICTGRNACTRQPPLQVVYATVQSRLTRYRSVVVEMESLMETSSQVTYLAHTSPVVNQYAAMYIILCKWPCVSIIKHDLPHYPTQGKLVHHGHCVTVHSLRLWQPCMWYNSETCMFMRILSPLCNLKMQKL